MADYNKLTVVQIRELFKSRNIATTGLTRKQQLIDRLLEEDARGADAGDAAQVDDYTPAADATDAGDDGQSEETIPAEPIEPPTLPESQKSDSQETSATLPPLSADHAAGGVIPEAQLAPQGSPISAAASVKNTDAALEMPIPTKEPSGPDVPNEQAEASEATHAVSASVSTTASPGPEESRKRKRRSVTPSVSEEEVAQKKAKQEGDGTAVVLKEDVVSIDGAHVQQQIETDSKDEAGETLLSSKEESSTPAAVSVPLPDSDKTAHKLEVTTDAPSVPPVDPSATNIDEPTGSVLDSPAAPTKLPPGRENWYKDLVSGRAEASAQDGVDDTADAQKDMQEREVAPALHPATSALYIRDFMRPLRPDALEAHLTSLAQPPKRQDDAEQAATTAAAKEGVIQKFHLDTIRTHCFVVFASVSAASRVRSAMHDRVWPVEGNRKSLWADFIPEDKVQGWIEIESSTGRGAGAKRWEVVYERLNDGKVATSLQEASAAPLGPRRSTTQGSSMTPAAAPSAPGLQMRKESSAPNVSAQQPASFVALDSLFKSTNAKPKLYYLPVSKELADRRLDELDALTSRQNAIPPGGSGYPDSRRYTFEQDDKLVDNGPEFGLRNVRPAARPFRGR